MKAKYEPKTNRQILEQWFPNAHSIVEALDLIKHGDDNEPYISNRLIRICMLTKVTTAASPDPEATTDNQKNATTPPQEQQS